MVKKRRVSKPRQHVRRLRSGKRIVVNKGVRKSPKKVTRRRLNKNELDTNISIENAPSSLLMSIVNGHQPASDFVSPFEAEEELARRDMETN